MKPSTSWRHNGEKDWQPSSFRHCCCLNFPLMKRGVLWHCCEISAVQRESQVRPVPCKAHAQVAFQSYGAQGAFPVLLRPGGEWGIQCLV